MPRVFFLYFFSCVGHVVAIQLWPPASFHTANRCMHIVSELGCLSAFSQHGSRTVYCSLVYFVFYLCFVPRLSCADTCPICCVPTCRREVYVSILLWRMCICRGVFILISYPYFSFSLWRVFSRCWGFRFPFSFSTLIYSVSCLIPFLLC